MDSPTCGRVYMLAQEWTCYLLLAQTLCRPTWLACWPMASADRSVGEPLLSIDKHRDGQLDRQSEYIMNGFKEIDRYSEVGVCAVRSIDTGMWRWWALVQRSTPKSLLPVDVFSTQSLIRSLRTRSTSTVSSLSLPSTPSTANDVVRNRCRRACVSRKLCMVPAVICTCCRILCTMNKMFLCAIFRIDSWTVLGLWHLFHWSPFYRTNDPIWRSFDFAAWYWMNRLNLNFLTYFLYKTL